MDGSVSNSEVCPPTALSLAKVLTHLRQPQNLLNYMILTAYMKFMGIGEYIPTITFGG